MLASRVDEIVAQYQQRMNPEGSQRFRQFLVSILPQCPASSNPDQFLDRVCIFYAGQFLEMSLPANARMRIEHELWPALEAVLETGDMAEFDRACEQFNRQVEAALITLESHL